MTGVVTTRRWVRPATVEGMLGHLLTINVTPAAIADALIANGYVAYKDRDALVELLYLHDRAHSVMSVTCYCGVLVFDFVAHQERCLAASGLLQRAV